MACRDCGPALALGKCNAGPPAEALLGLLSCLRRNA
jgi:hypothetical protein